MSLFQTAYIRETHPLEVTMQPVSKAEVLPQHPNYKPDLFAFKGSRQAPHISEYTLSYGDPEEYHGRILAGTVVHTGGGTSMAMIEHHTVERPKFPPGTTWDGRFTVSRYLPTEDPALQELQLVAEVIAPHLDALVSACQSYHTHTPDAWMTTGGFMVSSKKAGLQLSRAEYLALERSVPKDTIGRINYQHVAHLVHHLTAPMGQQQQQ